MTLALAAKEALVSLRLPQALLARLDGAAQQLQVTRSGLVRRILGAYLRREGKVVVQVVRCDHQVGAAVFEQAKTWTDQIRVLKQLMAEVYSHAQAFHQAEQHQLEFEQYRTIASLMRALFQALKEADLEALDRRLKALEEQARFPVDDAP